MIISWDYDGGGSGFSNDGVLTAHITGGLPFTDYAIDNVDGGGNYGASITTTDGSGNADVTMDQVGGEAGGTYAYLLVTNSDYGTVDAALITVGTAGVQDTVYTNVTWNGTDTFTLTLPGAPGMPSDLYFWDSSGDDFDGTGTDTSKVITLGGSLYEGKDYVIFALQDPVLGWIDVGVYWVTTGDTTVFFPSTAPPPIHAAFSADITLGHVPLTVNFTDHSSPGPSGPITGWAWDFGDGGTSTSQNPSHTFMSNGTFTVSLTVTGTSPDGTDSTTHDIDVEVPQILYAAAGFQTFGQHLYIVDTSTGAMTDVGDTGESWCGIAFDPTDGTLYGASQSASPTPGSLFTIDIDTAVSTLIGSLGGGDVTDLAFDASGQLWGWNLGPNSLVTINKSTGLMSANIHNVSDGYGALAFHPSGTLYHTNGSTSAIRTVNTSTGIETFVRNVTPGTFWDGGDIDDIGVLWGTDESDLWSVDISTGTATDVCTFGVGGSVFITSIAWQPPVVTPDFTIAVSPSTLTIAPGSNDDTTLNTGVLNADTESITLSDDAPSGITLTYTTNPITAGGSTNVHVDVGGGVAFGVYHITITGTGTGNTHTTSLTIRVTTGTSVTLNPNNGPCGITTDINGSGFAPSSALSIFFDGTDYTGSGYVTGTTTTDGSGNFSGMIFEIPNYSPGTYTVRIQDASGLSDTATFTVYAPAFSMSPSTIRTDVPANITVSGSHWPASTALTLMVHLGTNRKGGYQYEDALILGMTLVSGSFTTDSSGNFSAVIHVPANDFPAGTWGMVVAVDPAFPTAICGSATINLSVCSPGGNADTISQSHTPVLVGHAGGHDIPITQVSGVAHTRFTVSSQNYDLLEGYGTVLCGGYFYSLFRCQPLSGTPGTTLPFPSWYHTMVVVRTKADGTAGPNYYFVDPPSPRYTWSETTDSFDGSNNWHSTLSYTGGSYGVYHARIVTDGTDVWIAMISAKTIDYPYISSDDTQPGFGSSAAQLAARGGLSGMISTETSSPGTTWTVYWHRNASALGTPSPPDTDAGDNFSGTGTIPSMSVHHFNGSSFDVLGYEDASYCQLRTFGNDDLDMGGYLSGIAACASPAEAGVCHILWSEGGPWGRRYGGAVISGTPVYDVWDSNYPDNVGFFQTYGLGCANLDYRTSLSTWNTSGVVSQNNILHSHTDRSNRYTLTSSSHKRDPYYVQSSDMPLTSQVILKNDHGSVAAIVTRVIMAYGPVLGSDSSYDNNSYWPDLHEKELRYWDLSSGSINELQVMDDSLVPIEAETNACDAFFAATPHQLDRVNASWFVGDYSNGLAPNTHPIPNLARVQPSAGVLGVEGIIACPLYNDATLGGGTDVYIVGVGFTINAIDGYGLVDTNETSEGFYRIPVDGSQNFSLMDGDRSAAILPNPSVKAFGLEVFSWDDFISEPKNIWMIGYGLASAQYDRQCQHAWISPGPYYGQGSAGHLEIGGTMTGGSGNVLPIADWQTNDGIVYDGSDTIYAPGRWAQAGNDNTKLYTGVGMIVIDRTGSCPTCTCNSPIWFFKNGTWRQAGSDPNYNVYAYHAGSWHPVCEDPNYDVYARITGAWHSATS